MKCCVCGKEVDITEDVIPPTWYGKYQFDKLIEIICAACIKVPQHLNRWRKYD